MMKLSGSNIQLHARAGGKQEAIRNVGQLLVDSGHIDAAYIDSMLGREKIANTFTYKRQIELPAGTRIAARASSRIIDAADRIVSMICYGEH